MQEKPITEEPAAAEVAAPAQYTADGKGTLYQEPGLGGVGISDLSPAEFALAYPWGWASLTAYDPKIVAEVSGGALSEDAATGIKRLLAAALVREYAETRQSKIVEDGNAYMTIFGNAYYPAVSAVGLDNPYRLAAVIATMFDQPVFLILRLIKVERWKAER